MCPRYITSLIDSFAYVSLKAMLCLGSRAQWLSSWLAPVMPWFGLSSLVPQEERKRKDIVLIFIEFPFSYLFVLRQSLM